MSLLSLPTYISCLSSHYTHGSHPYATTASSVVPQGSADEGAAGLLSTTASSWKHKQAPKNIFKTYHELSEGSSSCPTPPQIISIISINLPNPQKSSINLGKRTSKKHCQNYLVTSPDVPPPTNNFKISQQLLCNWLTCSERFRKYSILIASDCYSHS